MASGNIQGLRCSQTSVQQGIHKALAQGQVGLSFRGGEGSIDEGDYVVAQLQVCATAHCIHLSHTDATLLNLSAQLGHMNLRSALLPSRSSTSEALYFPDKQKAAWNRIEYIGR